MSLWTYDGKIYKDAKGDTYQVIGERILVNESTVLKSWFGCTTVADIEFIGDDMYVTFNTGKLTISKVTEIKKKTKDEPRKVEKVLGECSLFTPGCPKENLEKLTGKKKKEE